MKPPSLRGQLYNYLQELPLAVAQLSHQKVRLAVAITGISFANILIFMQLGFRSSLFDGTARLQGNLNGDLYLISSRSKQLGDQTFSRRRLYQAAAIPGVETASPMYYTVTKWKNPATQQIDKIPVIGFNLAQPVLYLPDVNQQLEQIKLPDTVLFDRQSQSVLGPIAEWFDQGKLVRAEINDRRITVTGVFSLGGSLFRNGHVIVSDWNYLRLFGKTSLEDLHLGVIRLKPGTDQATVQQSIQAAVPQEVKVLTSEQLIKLEESYWEQDPAGVVFNFGTIMGFIVGVVIVYQVLYSDVNDHLAEYATLKAIGYSQRQLLLVVFQEALILAIFGFIPGYGLSVGMYTFIGNLIRIPIPMRTHVALQVFVLTLLMCLISGAIASRKLQSADPADIF
jgi:putative ABC transport system permease protein